MDRAGGSYIYNRVSGSDDSGWSPRNIDITYSGIDTVENRKNFIGNAVSGNIGTYTISGNSRFIEIAERHNIKIHAANAIESNSKIPNSQSVNELPIGISGATFPHGKPAFVKYSDGSEAAGIFTSNVSSSGLEPVNGSHYTKQINRYLVTKDRSIIQDIKTYFSSITDNKNPHVPNKNSLHDLIVNSPLDPTATIRRAYTTFNSETSKTPMVITSATLNSTNMRNFILEQLKQGKPVKLAESGMEEKDSAVAASQQKYLDNLAEYSKVLPGKLFIGHKKFAFESHENTISQGSSFLITSSRFGKGALDKGESIEVGLAGKNKRFVEQHQKDVNNLYDFKEITKTPTGVRSKYSVDFIDFVAKQKLDHNVNIKVNAQVDPRLRKMFDDTGAKAQVGGVLSSSFVEYHSRIPGHTKFSAYEKAELEELQSIEKDWFEKRTWGESWGQLGNRGILSTNLINFADTVGESWFGHTEEAVQARMNYYYRPNMAYRSTLLPDVVRGGLDYIENMEMNMLGFYTMSTGYSMLKNTAFSLTLAVAGAVTGKQNMTSSTLAKILQAPGMLSRAVAGDVSMGIMSRVAHAVDVLTGAAQSGSVQYAIDASTRSLINLNNSTGNVTRKIMYSGSRILDRNPFMKSLGISFVADVFLNMDQLRITYAGFVKKYGFMDGTKRALKYTVPILFKKRRISDSTSGLRLSKAKVGSFGVFAIVLLDQITGYLGRHVGGIDAARVDRANEILANAAAKVGTGMAPVQLSNTGNVDSPGFFGWRLVAHGMKAFWKNLIEDQSSMREILGPNVIVKGQEMEAAQKAALAGNERLATAYLLMANQGSDSFKDEIFKANLWKSWVFQVTPNPMLFTFTWSMTQHRSERGRSGLVNEQEDVEEFGFTLQGPVAVKIGMSVDLPYVMRRQLGKGKPFGYSPWSFEYKPGSSFANIIGITGFLHALDLTFKGAATVSGYLLTHTLSKSFQTKGMHSIAGALAGIGAVFEEFAEGDHAYILDPTKAGKGTASKISSPKISPARAVARILTLPATLPIQAAIMMVNIPLVVVEQASWKFAAKHMLKEFMVNGQGAQTRVGQIFEGIISESLGVDYVTRHMVRNTLDITDIAEFHKEFGDGSALTEQNKVEVTAKFNRYRNKVSRLRELTIRNPWNIIKYVKDPHIHFIPKAVAVTGHTAFFFATVTALALSMEASNNAYKGNAVHKSMAYDIANKWTRWAASTSTEQVAALNNDRATLFYKVIGKIDYENAPDMFRGALAILRGGLLMFDTTGHAFVPNFVPMLAGVVAEGFMLAAAGLRQEEVVWDPIKDGGTWRVKRGGVQTPGIGSTLVTWAVGAFKSFAKGFYHPLGQDQYVMMGPWGLTHRKTDKDMDEVVGRFAQFGVAMFLTSGFSEQFVFLNSWEKRWYAESKYVNDYAYKSMGLRQRLRDRQIRSGKMYHEQALAGASGWGISTELRRRSELFRWMKNVDSRDLLFVPGLVSADQKKLPSKETIRRFREPINTADRKFQEILDFFANDVVAAGDRPGQFEEVDDEINFEEAVLRNRQVSEKLGKAGEVLTRTPENFQQFAGGAFNLLLKGSMAMAAAIGVFGLLNIGIKNLFENHKDKLLNSFGRVGQNIVNTAAARRLKVLLPVAHMVETGIEGLSALKINDDIWVKGRLPAYGSGMDESLKAAQRADALSKKLTKKGKLSQAELNELEEAKRASKLSNVFYIKEELENGPLRSFYRTMNKVHGLSNRLMNLNKMSKMKSLETTLELKRINSNLSKIRNDVAETLKVIQELNKDGVDESLKASYEKGIKRFEQILVNIDNSANRTNTLYDYFKQLLFAKDANGNHVVKSKVHEALFLKDAPIDLQDGKGVTSLIAELDSVKKTLGEVNSELVMGMEEVGEITRLGDKADVRDLLTRLGVDPKKLDRIADLEEEAKQLGLGDLSKSGKGGNKILDLSFMREAAEEFDARTMTDMAEELDRIRPGEGQKLLQKMIEQAVEEGGSPGAIAKQWASFMISGGGATSQQGVQSTKGFTRQELRAFVESLLKSGQISPEVANELLENEGARIAAILNKNRSIKYATMAGKVLFSGAKLNILGHSVEFSLAKSITKLTGLAVLNQFFIGTELQKTAYYASQQGSKELLPSNLEEMQVKTQEAWINTVSGVSAGMAPILLNTAARIFVGAGLVELMGAIPILGSIPGLTIIAGLAAFVALDYGIRYLMGTSRKEMAEAGAKKLDPNFMGGLLVNVQKENLKIHKYFESEARRIAKLRYTNKNLLWTEYLEDVLYYSIWDPNKFETPGYGVLRLLVDAIGKEKVSGTGTTTWEYPGQSLSLNVLKHFMPHSVLFFGNIYDAGVIESGKQSSIIMQGAEGWSREVIHSTVFGNLPSSKVISPSKDGSDTFGPSWLRNEYIGQIFKPMDLVGTGIAQELMRRGDLTAQVISNLIDQRAFMGRIVANTPEYDPRSGAGLPPGAYVISVVDPSIFGRVFAEPLYSLPDSDSIAAANDKNPTGFIHGKPRATTLRGKFFTPPKRSVPVKTPKSTTVSSRTSIRSAAVPIMSAMEIKKDPLLRALQTARAKVAAKKKELEQKLASRPTANSKPKVYFVAKADVKNPTAHELSVDTATKKTSYGNLFAQREGQTNAFNHVVIDEHPWHDRHDIGIMNHADTADTGMANYRIDSFS